MAMASCNKEIVEGARCESIYADLSNFWIDEKVELVVDGKKTSRRVYNDEAGLFVFIKNYKVYREDFE